MLLVMHAGNELRHGHCVRGTSLEALGGNSRLTGVAPLFTTDAH
jgi:hypothetical protein